jgi:hypothetical protein
MKTSKQLRAKTRVLCAVASGLVWFSATGTAQTFTTIKSFGTPSNVTGSYPRSSWREDRTARFTARLPRGSTALSGGQLFPLMRVPVQRPTSFCRCSG